MKAVVFHGVKDIRVDDVKEPRIERPTDAIVRLTASAICGTDLHFVRGTVEDMVPGTILGHEGVGIVEELGSSVRSLRAGDRVVIPSTIACGNCSYCRAGYFAQCDNANPNGPEAGTSFYGGPKSSGPFQGLQAELARVPFANVGLVKLPDEISDEQAIVLSDILPTAYFAAELAEITPGDVVAVFGCGPVGQLAIACAMLLGAGRVLAIDRVASRLERAKTQGAEVINFDQEDPVQIIKELSSGIGVDRAIDAVGVDAEPPRAAHLGESEHWRPGQAPSQAVHWAVRALAKAGTLSIIGVYPPSAKTFPLGLAMNKNLTLKMGNCHHRKYIPKLMELLVSGVIDPSVLISQDQPLVSAVDAYRAFDQRQEGWLKVQLEPLALPVEETPVLHS